MPYAKNALDGRRVYFEEDGASNRPAVAFHGGLLDTVDLVLESTVAQTVPAHEFHRIFVDHRGLGRSDKPHDIDAYAMPLRVADAVAVLDEAGIDRAHFIGTSWGGRLGFGIGEHAPDRVRSLIIGGQQPYALDPNGPLVRTVTESLSSSREHGTVEPFVAALEDYWGVTIPDAQRRRYLDNDPVALDAAWRAALTEGAISDNLGAWQLPCLIFIGAADIDFLEQARRAADQIPDCNFIAIEERDHYGAHTDQSDPVLDAILAMLLDRTP